MYCNTQALSDLRAAGAAAIRPLAEPSLGGALYGCPDDCIGNYMYGVISSAPIAAGVTANVVAVPQKRNQPRRLFLSETTADTFLINSISVGVENLLATSGPIAAAIFIPNSTVGDFRRVVCEVSQDVTVQVANISGAQATFAATFSAYMLA